MLHADRHYASSAILLDDGDGRADGPLGLVGVVPALLIFNQPFGFNAILGVIGLAGILMRNTLILTEQIKENLGRTGRLSRCHRSHGATHRPVILTALAAVLAFIPLTHSSSGVRWPTR